MEQSIFLLLMSFGFVLIIGAMIYLYWVQQESVTQLLKPYNWYLIVDYLPTIPQKNEKDLRYFWEQLNIFLSDLVNTGKLTVQDQTNIISAGYSLINFIFFLLDRQIIDWEVYLNKYFYGQQYTC